jgi:hypothetical protein
MPFNSDLPRTPGVPILEPVDQPYLSPKQAGRPGEAIAEMGDDAQSLALESQGLVAKKREAQMTVDKVAAQNQYAAADEQFQIDLKKTQDSRDVPHLVEQHQQQLNEIAKQWGKSPAAIEIGLYGDSLRPRMQHLGDVREIDLMGKEWNAQIDLQLQTLVPQLVQAQRNGDRELSGQILSHVGGMYYEAVQKGLISKDDKDLALSAFRIGVQKQLNEASINSANPAERLQAIAQLKSGGSGPLDLTNLAAGDVSALRVHAEETNQRLDNLAESQNLNVKLNIMNNAFQAPEFKHNFEAQQNALEDPGWLARNGIVDQNGLPDLVTAKKLSAEVERERTFRNQEQQDRDEKVIEKYSAAIDESKISRADIDALPDEAHGGISNRARAQLIRQWTENWRINRQMATMDRQEARQTQQEISDGVRLEFYQRIGSGELVDPMEAQTSAGLTKRDRADVLRGIQLAKNEPDFAGAVSMLNAAIPVPPKPAQNATPEQMQAYQQQNARSVENYHETLAAYNDYMKAHPGQNKLEAMRKVLEPATHKRIADMLDQRFGVDSRESMWDQIKEGKIKSYSDLFSAWKDRNKTVTPSSTSETPTAPKVGDIKTFPNGRKGKWDGTGWVAQ